MKMGRYRIPAAFIAIAILAFALIAFIVFFSKEPPRKSPPPRETPLPPDTSSQVFCPKAKPARLIRSRIDNGPWTGTFAIHPDKDSDVMLGLKELPGARLSWYRIEPDISVNYKNANYPWERNPYKWIGLAPIQYRRTELTQFRDSWVIRPFGKPSPKDGTKNPTGSYWFQVMVEHNGRCRRSYGPEDNDKRGLNPKVFRVSVRNGDGYHGYLHTFFNVPGVFGSITYQSMNYIGADCADVLVAAYCAWKQIELKRNYNVATLVTGLPRVVKFKIDDGEPDRTLTWGKEIRPGYLIAVRYSGARGYQHIGAFSRDANGNGILDSPDILLHAGPGPLNPTRLGDGMFNGDAVVLKPEFKRLIAR